MYRECSMYTIFLMHYFIVFFWCFILLREEYFPQQSKETRKFKVFSWVSPRQRVVFLLLLLLLVVLLLLLLWLLWLRLWLGKGSWCVPLVPSLYSIETKWKNLVWYKFQITYFILFFFLIDTLIIFLFLLMVCRIL